MLSALILLGALLVIVAAIAAAWSDTAAPYKKRISLFGNKSDG
jgi:hypothetical protein